MTDPARLMLTEPEREQLLTVEEFAERVRQHPMTIYRRIKQNKQPGVMRFGRDIRINIAVALSKTDQRTHQS